MIAFGDLWAGLDYGAYESHVCVIDSNGAIKFQGSSDSSPEQTVLLLSPFREKLQLIGLEAGVGTHLARSLIGASFPVAAFEARQASKFLRIHRNKTDKNDALGLAQIARLARSLIATVHIKDSAFQRVRDWLTLRDNLVRQRMGTDAVIKALIQTYGVRVGYFGSSAALRREVERAIGELQEPERSSVAEDALPLIDMAITMRATIKKIDLRLAAFCAKNDVCGRFMKIPGIGPVTAASFYCAIEEPARFHSLASVGAYLGLTPRIHSSGRSGDRPRISKMGSVTVRRNLVLAARTLMRGSTKQDTALREWGLSLKPRSGARRAEIAVARKLAITMLKLWKSGDHFKPYPNLKASAEAG